MRKVCLAEEIRSFKKSLATLFNKLPAVVVIYEICNIHSALSVAFIYLHFWGDVHTGKSVLGYF